MIRSANSRDGHLLLVGLGSRQTGNLDLGEISSCEVLLVFEGGFVVAGIASGPVADGWSEEEEIGDFDLEITLLLAVI